MPDCSRCSSGLEDTAEHAFYYSEFVDLFWEHGGEWMTCIESKQLVLLDVGYIMDILPQLQGEKQVMFLAIARMVIWMR